VHLFLSFGLQNDTHEDGGVRYAPSSLEEFAPPDAATVLHYGSADPAAHRTLECRAPPAYFVRRVLDRWHRFAHDPESQRSFMYAVFRLMVETVTGLYVGPAPEHKRGPGKAYRYY
jgi:hypothetical protein